MIIFHALLCVSRGTLFLVGLIEGLLMVAATLWAEAHSVKHTK